MNRTETVLEKLAEVSGHERDNRVIEMLGADPDKPLRATRNSIVTILEEDPRWAGRVSWDDFTTRVQLDGVCLGGDHEYSTIGLEIERCYGAHPSIALLAECTEIVARQRSFHPVRDYLKRLEWDGVRRLERLLPEYLGADSSPLHAEYGRAFMIGMVARVMAPGCKLDTMLILMGGQGYHKSTAVQALMPRSEWFSDTPPDLNSKDAYGDLAGRWLYEIAELEAFKNASESTIKAFLSSARDSYRPAYARLSVTRLRQVVFFGTTNKRVILKDSTGSRRFWVVEVKAPTNREAIALDRDQLWAEAYHRYVNGEAWHLTPEFEALRTRQAQRFEAPDEVREAIGDWAMSRVSAFSTDEAIRQALGPDRLDRKTQMDVARILKNLGYEKSETRTAAPSGVRGPRLWVRP